VAAAAATKEGEERRSHLTNDAMSLNLIVKRLTKKYLTMMSMVMMDMDLTQNNIIPTRILS
jgi:hypothetical protein